MVDPLAHKLWSQARVFRKQLYLFSQLHAVRDVEAEIAKLLTQTFAAGVSAAIDRCALCGGLGFDGMPGEEKDCYASAPMRTYVKDILK